MKTLSIAARIGVAAILLSIIASTNYAFAQGTPTAEGTPVAVFPTASSVCDPFLGTPVAGTPVADQTPSPPVPIDVATLSFDLLYLDAMIPHHQMAIDMAVIARERTERPEIVDMAEAIIGAQQAELEFMMGLRADWYPDIPPLTNQQLIDGMTVQLSESPGVGGIAGLEDMATAHMTEGLVTLCETEADVDLAFIDIMIAHHSSAIVLGQEASTRLEHSALQNLAMTISTDQAAEIDQMLIWRDAWYPDAPIEDHHGG